MPPFERRASIDVKLSASPYKEKRTQHSGGFQYLHGKSTYTAGYIHSSEPDYKADGLSMDVSQEVFGGMTTVSLGFTRGRARAIATESASA